MCCESSEWTIRNWFRLASRNRPSLPPGFGFTVILRRFAEFIAPAGHYSAAHQLAGTTYTKRIQSFESLHTYNRSALCATIIGAGRLSATPVTWTLTALLLQMEEQPPARSLRTLTPTQWAPTASPSLEETPLSFQLLDTTRRTVAWRSIPARLISTYRTSDYLAYNHSLQLHSPTGGTLRVQGIECANGYGCYDDDMRYMTAGTLVGTPTPEPGTAALASIACVIGLVLFRRKTIWADKRITAAGVKGGSQ
jgi:hypothetical protein